MDSGCEMTGEGEDSDGQLQVLSESHRHAQICALISDQLA